MIVLIINQCSFLNLDCLCFFFGLSWLIFSKFCFSCASSFYLMISTLVYSAKLNPFSFSLFIDLLLWEFSSFLVLSVNLFFLELVLLSLAFVLELPVGIYTACPILSSWGLSSPLRLCSFLGDLLLSYF